MMNTTGNIPNLSLSNSMQEHLLRAKWSTVEVQARLTSHRSIFGFPRRMSNQLYTPPLSDFGSQIATKTTKMCRHLPTGDYLEVKCCIKTIWKKAGATKLALRVTTLSTLCCSCYRNLQRDGVMLIRPVYGRKTDGTSNYHSWEL